MNGAYAPPLTAPPPLLVGNQGATARSAAAPHYYPKGGFSMNECETYEECIQRRHNAFCKAVIRYAALSKISQLHREWKRQLSLDYLTNEKFVQFAEPEPDEEHPFTVCGQTVLLFPAPAAARDRCVLWSNTQHSRAPYPACLAAVTGGNGGEPP